MTTGDTAGRWDGEKAVEDVRALVAYADRLRVDLTNVQVQKNAEIARLQSLAMDLHQLMDEFDHGTIRPDDRSAGPNDVRNRLLGVLRELAAERTSRRGWDGRRRLVEAAKTFGKAVGANPVTRLREVAEYFIHFRQSVERGVDDRMVADACWAIGRLVELLEDAS